MIFVKMCIDELSIRQKFCQNVYGWTVSLSKFSITIMLTGCQSVKISLLVILTSQSKSLFRRMFFHRHKLCQNICHEHNFPSKLAQISVKKSVKMWLFSCLISNLCTPWWLASFASCLNIMENWQWRT